MFVRPSLRTYVRAYVDPSVHKKVSSISMKFGMYVESMSDARRYALQYDLIQGQGQGQGHEPLKLGKPTIFNGYVLSHLQCELWQLTTDS